MPGWKGSNRRSRLPTDWEQIRRDILDRDGSQCQHVRYDTGHKCLLPAHDVDHIINNDDDSYTNLQALCPWHHKQKSGREGGTASGKARRARAQQAKPLHPGLRD